jgi:ArsR family transcriptional regulator, cadmium/lead-responsive transcriptional repressor
MKTNLSLKTARAASENVHAKFFQGLADATRLRIVRLLLDRPSTVGELVARLGISQSGVSNHLACLKWCGYVTAERSGRWVRYRISDVRVRSLLKIAQSIVADNAKRLATCTRLASATD